MRRRLQAALEFPLLKLELVRLLRTKRAFWLLVTSVGITSLIPLLMWPSFWEGRAQDPLQNSARFNGFIMTQLIVSLFITPALTAPAFTVEREEQTFELVYSTLLSPFSIVLSKFLSSVGYLLILLAASSPAVSALYLLGGFGFENVVTSYAVTVAAIVSSSLVCLTVSLRSRGTTQAVVRSVVWVIVWNGGLSLVLWLLAALADVAGMEIGSNWLPPLAGMSPLSVLVWGAMDVETPWRVYLGYCGILSLLHLGYLLHAARNPYAVFQCRRTARRKDARGREKPRRLRRTVLSRLLLTLDHGRLPGLDNPVFQKEIKSEFFSRVLYRRGVFWMSALLYALLACVSASAWQLTWLHIVSSVNLFLILVLVPAVAATSVTREREKGNLDFLRSTLLSMRSVLRGKFLAALYSNWGLFAAMLWVTAATAFVMSFEAGAAHPSKRAAGLGVLAIVAGMTLFTYAFTAAVGLLASTLSRRSINALLLSYGAVLFMCIGLPILFELFGSGSLRGPLAMATQPFVALNTAIEEISRRHSSSRVYEMLAYHAVLYGLGTLGLLWLGARLAEARLARDR